MPFPYKTVLVTGATSGIGLALAERMVEEGIFVVAVGRRRDRLEALVAKHGADRVAAEPCDVADLEGMPGWVKRITSTYPTLDSILLNAGQQQTVNFADAAGISPASLTAELHTNYLSPLHMLTLFLPHLASRASRGAPASVVLVTSGLALVPIARCANYCASKAALHSLAWTLRSQLAAAAAAAGAAAGPSASGAPPPVRVIEIVPPAVQTELHTKQPDLVAAGLAPMGMPLADFTNETWDMLAGEEVVDEILVGPARRWANVEAEKKKGYQFLEGMARRTGSKA